MFTRLFSSRVQALCEAGAFTTPVVSLFKNKQYALVYFGAGWAPGCQDFSPLLQDFRARHATAKQFEVLYVSLDRTEQDFQAYLEQLDASSPNKSAVFPALAYEDALVQGPVLMGDFEAETLPTVLVFETRVQKRTATTAPAATSTAGDAGRTDSGFASAATPSASASSAAPRLNDAAATELVFRLVSRRGREHIESDPDAAQFPWAHPDGLDGEASAHASDTRMRRRVPLVAGAVAVLSAVALATAWR